MPYRQNLTWVRPEALVLGQKQNFDIQALGEYKVSFFEFQLLTDSNAKTLDKSFIDYFKHFTAAPLSILPIDPVNEFLYKPRKQPMVVNEYMRWGPQQYVDPAGQWYGAKTLWCV